MKTSNSLWKQRYSAQRWLRLIIIPHWQVRDQQTDTAVFILFEITMHKEIFHLKTDAVLFQWSKLSARKMNDGKFRRWAAAKPHIVDSVQASLAYLCGTHSDPKMPAYWGENNIAILDLNTFKMHRLEINRYGEDGEPVTTKAGYFQTGIMETENGWLNSMTFPDHGYASVQIPNVAYSINRKSVENHLL